MRLQRFLALSGVASRRASEALITSGRVSVNGRIVTRLGTNVDPQRDTVEVDGKSVQEERKLYVLLNKPAGYLTAVADARGRSTVSDLVAGLPARLYPVGRLDMDTEGVLLLTNDGDFSFRLAHPRFGVEKVYHATVAGKPGAADIEALKRGVDIGGVVTSPAKVRMFKAGSRHSTIEITIHEGRKRQVKRMCKAIGHPVIRLRRIEYGGIRLGNLKPGQHRLLTHAEIESLRRKTELNV
ncbi:MAG: rRNA pseudouridine synthase [Candidatus Abyssobacteria bacterium SURF_5]|uniref:Pseudouridine synthase n=1 Tax=Abyssobacteria bacterium (strain SURF_5) TaxID=2093360 RepID=A0A3A4NNJ6_ABYX5|nr:MAG: rRNA pseudouridine synthase [Candidatus Abyssubacteria bacterium SURF_5]